MLEGAFLLAAFRKMESGRLVSVACFWLCVFSLFDLRGCLRGAFNGGYAFGLA